MERTLVLKNKITGVSTRMANVCISVLMRGVREIIFHGKTLSIRYFSVFFSTINPYPTAFPYGNGMVLHFYQQQESSTTKTVHKVINKGLKTYV